MAALSLLLPGSGVQAADYSQGLAASVAGVKEGLVEVQFQNTSAQEIRLWEDSCSWGWDCPRLLVVREGRAELFVKEQTGFTVNYPGSKSIAPQGVLSWSCDLERFVSTADKSPMSKTTQAADLLLLYQSRADIDAIGLNVWMGEVLGQHRAGAEDWKRFLNKQPKAAPEAPLKVEAVWMAKDGCIEVTLTNQGPKDLHLKPDSRKMGHDPMEFVVFTRQGPAVIWHRPGSWTEYLPEDGKIKAGASVVRKIRPHAFGAWCCSSPGGDLGALDFEWGYVIYQPHSGMDWHALGLLRKQAQQAKAKPMPPAEK